MGLILRFSKGVIQLGYKSMRDGYKIKLYFLGGMNPSRLHCPITILVRVIQNHSNEQIEFP